MRSTPHDSRSCKRCGTGGKARAHARRRSCVDLWPRRHNGGATCFPSAQRRLSRAGPWRCRIGHRPPGGRSARRMRARAHRARRGARWRGATGGTRRRRRRSAARAPTRRRARGTVAWSSARCRRAYRARRRGASNHEARGGGARPGGMRGVLPEAAFGALAPPLSAPRGRPARSATWRRSLRRSLLAVPRAGGVLAGRSEQQRSPYFVRTSATIITHTHMRCVRGS